MAVKFRIQKFVHGREKLKGLLVLFPEKHTSLTHLYINLIIVLKRGAQKLAGYNLKVVWAEFSTLSKAVFFQNNIIEWYVNSPSKLENSAQVSSC